MQGREHPVATVVDGRIAGPGPSARALRRVAAAPWRLWTAGCFGVIALILAVVVRLHFRRVRVRHRARLPRHGPVLVAANHPAAWTDVLVLTVALRRKLHFLALESLFRPTPRGWLLRLFGSLPVDTGPDDGHHRAVNAATFERCLQLLAGGEVVAVFPEGVSDTDRVVRPLRPGLARLALARARMGDVALVPVGLHYRDRAAFRSDVEVSVGEPVSMAALAESDAGDPERTVRALTARVHAALRSLTLDEPRPERCAILEALGDATATGARSLERDRTLARGLERMAAAEPESYARLRRAAITCTRMRRVLRVSPAAITRWRHSRRLADAARSAAIVLGWLPAAVGAILAWPLRIAVAAAVARFGAAPRRVAFVRMVAGMLVIPAACAALAVVAAATAGPGARLLAAPLAVLLAAWARVHAGLRDDMIERRRLARAARRSPRAIERLLAAHRELGVRAEMLLREPSVGTGGVA